MTMRITDKNGPVMAVRQVLDEDGLIIASDQGKVIRTRVHEISEVGRVAQGVRVIHLEEGETVGAVAKLDKEEDDGAAAPLAGTAEAPVAPETSEAPESAAPTTEPEKDDDTE